MKMQKRKRSSKPFTAWTPTCQWVRSLFNLSMYPISMQVVAVARWPASSSQMTPTSRPSLKLWNTSGSRTQRSYTETSGKHISTRVSNRSTNSICPKSLGTSREACCKIGPISPSSLAPTLKTLLRCALRLIHLTPLRACILTSITWWIVTISLCDISWEGSCNFGITPQKTGSKCTLC